jgi:outer membrane protein OmpA-like peptidoglycan-associated protein
MRILTTGIVAFVIWSFVAAWLYNDKLLPAMNDKVTMDQTIQNPKAPSDSLDLIRASMPGNLPIYFEFNKSEFKPDPQYDGRIDEFKKFLEKYQASALSVKGYTDLVGAPEFNNALGLKRAIIVQQYLVEKGIPSGRMNAESGGEDISSDYITEEGRAKARRTEISVKF